MNDLKIYENKEFGEIRTVNIDGEPWFVGVDIATALGYSNTRDAIAKHIDNEDKATVAIHDGRQKKKYNSNQRKRIIQPHPIQRAPISESI